MRSSGGAVRKRVRSSSREMRRLWWWDAFMAVSPSPVGAIPPSRPSLGGIRAGSSLPSAVAVGMGQRS